MNEQEIKKLMYQIFSEYKAKYYSIPEIKNEIKAHDKLNNKLWNKFQKEKTLTNRKYFYEDYVRDMEYDLKLLLLFLLDYFKKNNIKLSTKEIIMYKYILTFQETETTMHTESQRYIGFGLPGLLGLGFYY